MRCGEGGDISKQAWLDVFWGLVGLRVDMLAMGNVGLLGKIEVWNGLNKSVLLL